MLHHSRNSLTIPNSPWVRRWLLLAVTALALSGIAPLLLLAGRASFMAESAAIKAFFPVVLVVHVDLSVLVWFLAIACMMWSVISCRTGEPVPYLRGTSFWSFAAGALAIALSPLHPDGQAVMNNYVPVINNPVFFLGISLVSCAVLLALADLLLAGAKADMRNLPDLGIVISALITLLAFACFLWTNMLLPQMPQSYSPQHFYEIMFWAGGHVLQFTYVQLLLIAWLVLAVACLPALRITGIFGYGLMATGIIAALISPLAFILYEVGAAEYMGFFTHHMRYLGGIAPLLLGGFVTWQLLRHHRQVRQGRALLSCLIMSIVVFAAGGVLGFMISGVNVIIPAHYHGSIVGVTLALMGLCYLLLPRLGFSDIAASPLALWQPVIYGGGQLMHILGLARAGGYGVARKTAGALAEGQMGAEIAMQVMRIGGILAVIGGGLFVVLILRSIFRQRGVERIVPL